MKADVLTVVRIVADLLFQVIWGHILRLRPFISGSWFKFSTAAVAAAAETAATVTSSQNPTEQEQTLEQKHTITSLPGSCLTIRLV